MRCLCNLKHLGVLSKDAGTPQPKVHQKVQSEAKRWCVRVWFLTFFTMTITVTLATSGKRENRRWGPFSSASVCISTFKGKSWALLEWKHFSNLLARHWDREHSKVKGLGLPVCLCTRTGLRSPEVWPTLWHRVCWGMCNYGGQAFDPGFPSGLNCPHIERCSVSLGTPLYSAVLSCAPLWNSKHPLLKSELWPAHAPVQDIGRGL